MTQFISMLKKCVCVRAWLQERRLAAVTELVRLLKPGGQALIYVWAMEQEYNKQKSKYLKDSRDKENTNPTEDEAEHPMKQNPLPNPAVDNSSSDDTPKLSVHTNRTAFNSQDLLVPWHLKGAEKNTCQQGGSSSAADTKKIPAPAPVFHRYYHVFQKGELESLCRLVRDIEIRTSYHDQGNWCVILEKAIK